MNIAYVAIGAAFIAIGSASVARGKKVEDEARAKNANTSGLLMMIAGAIFMITGFVAGTER